MENLNLMINVSIAKILALTNPLNDYRISAVFNHFNPLLSTIQFGEDFYPLIIIPSFPHH